MDCPKCGQISPPGALRCDCGYDFASKTMRESYLPPVKPRQQGSMEAWLRRRPAIWAILCGAVLLIAAALTSQIAESYDAASPGATGSGVGALGGIMGVAFVSGVLGLAGLVATIRSSSRVAGGFAFAAGLGGFLGVAAWVFGIVEYIFTF